MPGRGGHTWGVLEALGADCRETKWVGVETGGQGVESKFDSQVKEEEHCDNHTHHTPAQKIHRSGKGPLSEWTTTQLDEMSTPLQILTPTWEVGHIPPMQEQGSPFSIKPFMTFQHGSVAAKKQEDCECSPMNEWIDQMWYVCTMEYYSAIKRYRVQLHATTKMNLKNISLN